MSILNDLLDGLTETFKDQADKARQEAIRFGDLADLASDSDIRDDIDDLVKDAVGLGVTVLARVQDIFTPDAPESSTPTPETPDDAFDLEAELAGAGLSPAEKAEIEKLLDLLTGGLIGGQEGTAKPQRHPLDDLFKSFGTDDGGGLFR